MALIFHLSSQPDPLPAVTERVWDKALHLGAYAALGLLFFRAFLGEGAAWIAAAALAFAATSAYGASDECISCSRQGVNPASTTGWPTPWAERSASRCFPSWPGRVHGQDPMVASFLTPTFAARDGAPTRVR